MNWEMLATTLTERWFTVMVGELIVMGGIQIMKDYAQSKMRIAEIKAIPVYNMENEAEELNAREDLSDDGI
jgi:cell division protein ZapA (FtsZ GTPase activity inhibitor)